MAQTASRLDVRLKRVYLPPSPEDRRSRPGGPPLAAQRTPIRRRRRPMAKGGGANHGAPPLVRSCCRRRARVRRSVRPSDRRAACAGHEARVDASSWTFPSPRFRPSSLPQPVFPRGPQSPVRATRQGACRALANSSFRRSISRARSLASPCASANISCTGRQAENQREIGGLLSRARTGSNSEQPRS